jgi:hypothetical protein
MNAAHLSRIMLIAATLYAGGCSTHTGQIKNFGSACGSIGTDAQKGYSLLDDSIKKKQIYSAALHPINIVTGKTFEGILSENERLATRTKLLSALSDYATALSQLADKDFRKGIDKSSKDLAGALSDMKNTYEKSTGSNLDLTNSDIYILSTVVDGVGSAYVEYKRRQAIKTIVVKADPAVQQVSQLLQKEFSEIGPVVQRELNTVETDFEKAYNSEATNMVFQSRIEALEKIQIAHDNANKAGAFYDCLGKAAGKMGETHALLKKSVEQNKWTSEELFFEVQELANWAKSVNDFYCSLK